MGAVIIGAIAVVMVVLAIANRRALVIVAIVLSGVPMSLIDQKTSFLAALGGMNAQAAYGLALLLASSAAVLAAPSSFLWTVRRTALLAAFLVFSAASIFWTSDLLVALRMLAKVGGPLVFLWVVISIARQRNISDAVEKAIYAACLISISLATVHWFTGDILAPRQEKIGPLGIPMLAAPFTSSANFSFLLLVGAITAYCRCLASRRLVHFLVLGIFVGAIALAFVRITFAALALAVLIAHTWRASAVSITLTFVSVIAAVVLVGTSEPFMQRMFYDPTRVEWSQLINDPHAFLENVDSSGRTTLWRMAQDDFRGTSPMIGAGIGAVDAWIRSGRSYGSELHSEAFRLYLELGWLGLSLYVSAMFWIWLQLRKATRKDRSRNGESATVLARASYSILPAYLLTMMTDNTLNYSTDFSVLAFATVAVGLVCANGGNFAVASPKPGIRLGVGAIKTA